MDNLKKFPTGNYLTDQGYVIFLDDQMQGFTFLKFNELDKVGQFDETGKGPGVYPRGIENPSYLIRQLEEPIPFRPCCYDKVCELREPMLGDFYYSPFGIKYWDIPETSSWSEYILNNNYKNDGACGSFAGMGSIEKEENNAKSD